MIMGLCKYCRNWHRGYPMDWCSERMRDIHCNMDNHYMGYMPVEGLNYDRETVLERWKKEELRIMMTN